MKLTEDWLKKVYRQCNKDYFDNSLPYGIHLYSVDNYEVIGRFVSLSGKYDINDVDDLGILINADIDYTDETIKMVLLHEMVHEYLLLMKQEEYQKQDPHGQLFKDKCLEISETHNIKQFFRSNIIDNLPILQNHKFYLITIDSDEEKVMIGRLKSKKWVSYFKEYFIKNRNGSNKVNFYESKSHALRQFDENNGISLLLTEIDKKVYKNEIRPWLNEI